MATGITDIVATLKERAKNSAKPFDEVLRQAYESGEVARASFFEAWSRYLKQKGASAKPEDVAQWCREARAEAP